MFLPAMFLDEFIRRSISNGHYLSAHKELGDPKPIKLKVFESFFEKLSSLPYFELRVKHYGHFTEACLYWTISNLVGQFGGSLIGLVYHRID